MTPNDLAALRRELGINQSEMAERIGMRLRAYQDIEGGLSKLRPIHVAAAERAALALAVERRSPMLAPASIRSQALDLVALIRGEEGEKLLVIETKTAKSAK